VENKANAKLQARLRREIKDRSLNAVATAYKLDSRTLARYLANLPMSVLTFRGIEAVVEETTIEPTGGR
jgi:hypothetical protein